MTSPETADEQELDHRTTVFQSVLKHPYLVIIAGTIVLGLVAAVTGYRQTEYRTDAQYAMGGARVTNQELPGYITATNAQAAIVARLLATAPTIDRIAVDTGLTADHVRTAVSATNIPDSPIIRIRATGTSPELAIDLATAAGKALTVSLKDLESAGGQVPARTLERYVVASKTYLQAQADAADAAAIVDKITRQIDEADVATESMRATLAAGRKKSIVAELVATEAKATADGLREIYGQQLRAASSGTDLQLVSSPAVVLNNNGQKLQLALGVGVPLALAIPAFMAWFIERRKWTNARSNGA